MENASVIVTSVGGAIAAILGAYALLTRSRNAGARPLQVLTRLWDWVEGNEHDKPVPETLRRDVEAVIAEGREEAT